MANVEPAPTTTSGNPSPSISAIAALLSTPVVPVSYCQSSAPLPR